MLAKRMPRANSLAALAAPLLVLASCGPKATETPIANIPAPLPENIPLIEAPPPPPPVMIGKSKGEDLWHLRSGLNVAVLLCQGADNQAMVASYNSMLNVHKGLLSSAAQSEVDHFRVGGGKKWQDAYDDHMTKVYNAYSGTLTREPFCSRSTAILQEVVTDTTPAFTEKATVLLWELNKAAGIPDPDGKLARSAFGPAGAPVAAAGPQVSATGPVASTARPR